MATCALEICAMVLYGIEVVSTIDYEIVLSLASDSTTL